MPTSSFTASAAISSISSVLHALATWHFHRLLEGHLLHAHKQLHCIRCYLLYQQRAPRVGNLQ
jgi:hypothetical protein